MSVNLTTPLAKTWQRRLDRWHRSGLSAAAFGKKEKVSQPRLYTWRKRFVDAGLGAQAVPAQSFKPAFIPAQIRLTQAPLELVLHSGHLLRLSADFSPDRLAEILKAVAGC